MSGRPSDGMDFDELREEFDWISEFQSRMAERIRGDADVYSLVDYVDKLEHENVKLLKKVFDLENDAWAEGFRDGCEAVSIVTKDGHKVYMDEIAKLREENAKLREVVNDTRWHLMADEQPRDSVATYVIMGKRGAVYLALGFDNRPVFGECFLIPNNRRGLMEFDKIKAWLKVPVYGEV